VTRRSGQCLVDSQGNGRWTTRGTSEGQARAEYVRRRLVWMGVGMDIVACHEDLARLDGRVERMLRVVLALVIGSIWVIGPRSSGCTRYSCRLGLV
jgi:hypothetical protein